MCPWHHFLLWEPGHAAACHEPLLKYQAGECWETPLCQEPVRRQEDTDGVPGIGWRLCRLAAWSPFTLVPFLVWPGVEGRVLGG